MGVELSPEYAVLGLQNPGYSPEPWSPVDSIAWLKAMAWDLRSNLGDEIDRALLANVLPPEEVADIGARVATALAALHRQHVVHLDIKPSNIMFRPDGTAVLVDFGLSRHELLPDLLEEEFSLPMGTMGTDWRLNCHFCTCSPSLALRKRRWGITRSPPTWSPPCRSNRNPKERTSLSESLSSLASGLKVT